MRRFPKYIAISILAGVAVLPNLSRADILSEGWYRMRSQSNMKIGNYAAAIEAYEKFLELKPKDREALKGISLAYEKQGETDKAIARYDKYLEIYHDDAEIAFKQANYLIWSRYAYRREDAIHYFLMGLKIEDDPQQRLKLAQLLAQDKKDLQEAVKQYELLLKQDPEQETVREEYRQLLLWDDRYLTKSIEQYEYFVERNPKNFKGREQLAALLGKSKNRKKEGVEIYAQLVKEKPNDQKLRHDYAKLLSVIPGYFDEARQQYQILLSKKPTIDIMTEAAELLEQKQATRLEARDLYSKILAKEPRNHSIRMKRASLYMNEKNTADLALKDYRTVIKQSPENAAAHRGAAKAFAWLDRPDDALFHAKLAKKYSRKDRRSDQLHRELAKGREPKVSALFEFPHQSGDELYKLSGSRIGVDLFGDVTPYLSLGAQLGHENYKGEGDDASGSWWQFRSEYRISPKEKINASFENHSIRQTSDSATMSFSYTKQRNFPDWTYTLGYASHLVTDSLLSLVGDQTNQIGGATRHEFYGFFQKENESKYLAFRPTLGWVDSESEGTNEYINLSGTVRVPLPIKKDYQIFAGTDGVLMSYANDHSGFGVSNSEPLSGGYFSPQMFASVLLYANTVIPLNQDSELALKAGAKFQLVDDASVSGETSGGFYGSVFYTFKQSESLYLNIGLEHDKVGDLYSSTMLQGRAVMVF